MSFKISLKVTKYFGYFYKKNCAKNCKKSPNLVTLVRVLIFHNKKYTSSYFFAWSSNQRIDDYCRCNSGPTHTKETLTRLGQDTLAGECNN